MTVIITVTRCREGYSSSGVSLGAVRGYFSFLSDATRVFGSSKGFFGIFMSCSPHIFLSSGVI